MAGVSADEIATLQAYQSSTYIDCSLLCLVIYEFIITFEQEVSCIWTRKLTATSLLLLFTRWTMVLSEVIVWIPFDSACVAYYTIRQLLFFFAYAQVALLSGLRVYALWHNSQLRFLFLAVVLLLGSVPIWTNAYRWSVTSIAYYGPPFDTCNISIAITQKTNDGMLYFTRSSAIAVDVIVLALTWAKTFQHWRQSRLVSQTMSVSSLFIRDGTLYFAMLLAMNVAQVLTYSRANDYYGNSANTFLQNIPPILVQRFMLNLRAFSGPGRADSGESDAAHFSRFSISFRVPSDFLGNIGEPLGRSSHDLLSEGEDDAATEWSTTNVDSSGSEGGTLGSGVVESRGS